MYVFLKLCFIVYMEKCLKLKSIIIIIIIIIQINTKLILEHAFYFPNTYDESYAVAYLLVHILFVSCKKHQEKFSTLNLTKRLIICCFFTESWYDSMQSLFVPTLLNTDSQ